MNLSILPDSFKAQPPILNDSSRGSPLEQANSQLSSYFSRITGKPEVIPKCPKSLVFGNSIEVGIWRGPRKADLQTIALDI